MHNNTELELVAQLLSKDKEISLAIAFGSIAKGTIKTHSDIDLAILTHTPLQPDKKIALIEGGLNCSMQHFILK